METTRKPMTGIGKFRRLAAVEATAQRDVRWRCKNDPEYRVVVEKLRQENAANRVGE